MLNHFYDAVTLADHPAIIERIFGLKSQHDHGGRIWRIEPINHGLHGVRWHKGHIPIENEDITLKAH